jgi:hypothetical protein
MSEDLEARIAQLEQQLAAKTNAEHDGWVRDAAEAARWHTPSDATRYLEGEQIDSPEVAAEAVRRLTSERPYMARAAHQPRDTQEAMSMAAMAALEKRGILPAAEAEQRAIGLDTRMRLYQARDRERG